MKLMILRQSGRPADLQKAIAYDTEWKQLFDKAELKADAVFAKQSGKLTSVPRMIVLQRLLRFIERQLTLKHGSEDWVEVPKTAKAWNTLISKYQDTPILVAKRGDKDGLVLVLMDMLS